MRQFLSPGVQNLKLEFSQEGQDLEGKSHGCVASRNLLITLPVCSIWMVEALGTQLADRFHERVLGFDSGVCQ